MKIRYLTGMAGVDFVAHRDDVREVDDAEAQRLIAAGFAEAIQENRPAARRERAVSRAAGNREKAIRGEPSAEDLDRVAAEQAAAAATQNPEIS